jgi:hypothetical protein
VVAWFNIRRERWTLEEIPTDKDDRPGRGAFALILDNERFPSFRHPQSRCLAKALEKAAAGCEAPAITLGSVQLQVQPVSDGVQVLTPAGAIRMLSIREAMLLAKDLVKPLAQTFSGPPQAFSEPPEE